jgi:tetratricopeptide (TPR) repeat protein
VYDWLSTELSETLAADLAASPQVHVTPSDDVARLKTEMSVPPNGSLTREDPASVRSALQAGYLVSGGYTVAGTGGDHLSIDVKLQSPSSDANADFHASGTQADYRKLVADLAAQLRKSLGATRALSADAADAQNIYPQDTDARRLYFTALDKLRAFDAPAAAELLQQASAKENTNVAIHSALADAWSQLRLDPQAAKEAQIAADLAQNSSTALPLEYVVQTTARAAEMNKKWDDAASQYRTLWNKYHRLNYGLRLASVLSDGGKLDPCPWKDQQPCGGPEAGLKVLDQLKSMPAPLGTDPRIQMGYARTYGAMTKAREQLAAAQAAFNEAKQRGSRTMQANAQLELCWAYRSQGNVDEASTPCNQAHELFMAIGDNVSGAVALNDLATLLSDKGRNAEALPVFDRVIAMNKAAGATRDYAGANVNAAMAAIMLGKTQDAQDYLDAALKAAQQVGDKYDEGRARIMRAEILAGANKLPEAEAEAKQALALAKDAQDEEMQSSALMKIAEYQEKTNPQSALKTYEEVLRMRRKNNDQRGVATCLNNMGELSLEHGDLSGAEQRFQESLKLFTGLKMKNAAAQDLLSLAEVDFRRKNLSAAESKAREALKEFQGPERKDPESEQAAVSLLAKIQKAH